MQRNTGTTRRTNGTSHLGTTRPDPDGAGSLTSPVTTYGYSGTTRKLVTITDPLSHAATVAYDYLGLFDQITAADGGVQKLDPYQSRGIPASGNNSATHLDKGIAEDYCYRVEMSIIF